MSARGEREPTVAVLYVGSWGRSGSTLLDLILGQVTGFASLGEVRYLWDRGLLERQLCGCGVPVPECPFWGAVLEEAFGAAREVDAAAMVELRRRLVAGLGWVLSPRRPRAYEHDLAAYRDVLARVYRAARAVSGASVLVDSSKYAAYGWLLAGAPGVELRMLHLVRDSRAVAYSWMRRRRRPEVPAEERYMPVFRPWRSAVLWNLEHLALHQLRRSARGYRLLRYEDLCAEPRRALGAALEQLGVAADLSFLGEGRVSLGPNHAVAGNPLRFRRGEVSISPDVEWRSGLEPGPRRLVTALTWPLLLRYGFPLRRGAP